MKMKMAAACALLFFVVVAAMTVWGVPHPRAFAKEIYHKVKKARQEARLAAYAGPAERADAPLLIYGDALGDGWQDWSWATHDLSDKSAHIGKASVRMTPTENRGVYFHHDTFSTVGYGTLSLWVQGQADLLVSLADEDKAFGPKVSLLKYVSPANGWRLARIPLADLGAGKTGKQVSGICIQASSAALRPDVRIDEIALLPDLALPSAPTSYTVAVTVDAAAERHPISPLVYGMAFAPADYVTDLHLGLSRWGGNDKSRYNWVLGNACNAARDWHFANRKAADSVPAEGPSSAADAFVRTNTQGGAQSLLTVPTIGWVAKDTDNSHASLNVPDAGKTAGYDPAANRALTSVASLPRKGRPFVANPTMADGAVYQDEWIYHLKNTFGSADKGGVRFYAMDNEPMLWNSTHTDVHPAPVGYDDLLSTFLTYADAVKAVDPAAQITGPVSWGWTGYQFSAKDAGTDNYHTHADQNAHGGQWLLPWFLAGVRAHDAKVGHRTLDVLDVHFYPQGANLYGSAADKDARARRLRSVRGLWDKTYVDESWINAPVMLLPRMKEWVSANYPGTKLGITEYNFGAENDPSGGLAVADALGVFGREGLDLACYWAYPPKDSPAYNAFRLLRNADGQGAAFGDASVHAASADPDKLGVYAATDAKTGDLTLLLLNKLPSATVSVPLALTHFAPGKLVRAWQCAGDMKTIKALPATAVWSGKNVSLPPYSMTLLHFPAAR